MLMVDTVITEIGCTTNAEDFIRWCQVTALGAQYTKRERIDIWVDISTPRVYWDDRSVMENCEDEALRNAMKGGL